MAGILPNELDLPTIPSNAKKRAFASVRHHKATRREIQAALSTDDAEALFATEQANTRPVAVFTNSAIVGRRLMDFNGVASQVLYPPLFDTSAYRRAGFGDELVSVCRVEHHKRQDLMVKAMAYVQTPVRLRICGVSSDPDYAARLNALIKNHNLQDRVILELSWVSEERKAALLSDCLANLYAPVDEDSYGYPTLEAAAAGKPTITATDSGGTLEFIEDGKNGLVVEPTPLGMAAAFDRLHENKQSTRTLGLAARQTVTDLNINWDHVVDRLLA